MNQNLPPILRIGQALDESSRLQPIRQLHHGVMPQNQTVRQLADGRPFSLGQPLERQQRLMMLRLKTVLPGLQFAEMKKLPELESKLSQVPVIA